MRLNPSDLTTYSTRLLAAADEWAHFKVLKLRFRMHPTPSGVTANQAMGWVGGVQDTLPGTFTQVGELLSSCFLAGETTVPTEWVECSGAEISGPLPWYKSVSGAADATEEAPGYFVVVGTGTETFNAEIRGILQFKTSISTANTPKDLESMKLRLESRRRAMREKEGSAILDLLSSLDRGSGPGSPLIIPPEAAALIRSSALVGMRVATSEVAKKPGV